MVQIEVIMKKHVLALLALLALGGPALAQQVGPVNTILCNKKAILTAGPTTITQMVAPVVGQVVNVCGWHVTNSGASGTFSFSSGNGSNCGSNTVLEIPVSNVTSSAPSADHIEFASWTAPLSMGICITPSVATIAAVVWYSQF